MRWWKRVTCFFIPDPDSAVIDSFCSIPALSMTGDEMIIDAPENRPPR